MSSIITLTGDLGSGKSTVSKILIEKLGYEYIYTGAIQRKIAERYNMTTTELNIYSETHPEIDEEIDAIFKSCNNAENLIIDSRLAWFFVPNSFKVYLKTNIIVAVDRIIADKQRKNEKYYSKEDAVTNILERKLSENRRYLDFYGANPSNMTNYDLILDSSYLSIQEVADIILENFKLWQKNPNHKAVFISPKNIYPLKSKQQFIDEKNDEKIILTTFKTNDFILNGHKIVEKAIKNEEKLISNIEYSSENKFIFKENDIINIKEWEKECNFNFLTYPKI